jgi:hypothetical protein
LLFSFVLKENSKIKPAQSFQVNLRQVPKDNTVEQEKELSKVRQKMNEIAPKKIKPKEIKPKTEDYIDPSLFVEEYSSGDTSGSSNQKNKDQTELDYGVKQNTERQKQASTKTDVEDIEGMVTTTAERNNASNKGKGDEIELPAFYDEIIGSDDDILGSDQETNDSVGEKEKGALSDKEIVIKGKVDILPELIGNLGNMRLLDDFDLDEAIVYDPYSEKHSAELKLVNRYFKRIIEQISENWLNPLSLSEKKQGLYLVIRMEINTDGTLKRASKVLQSGHPELDESLLRAIKRVAVFGESIQPSIRENFSQIILRWRSDGKEYELMPFETEPLNKQEN